MIYKQIGTVSCKCEASNVNGSFNIILSFKPVFLLPHPILQVRKVESDSTDSRFHFSFSSIHTRNQKGANREKVGISDSWLQF